MNRLCPVSFFVFFFWVSLPETGSSQISGIPKTPKIPATITYCKDTVIVDNYRWLENLKDTTVKAWFNSQGQSFDNLLAHIPGRDSLLNELKSLDGLKAENISDIRLKNNCYFFLKSEPGESSGKLYMRQGKEGQDELLFDPNSYQPGRTFSITFQAPSEDASKIAIGISQGGAELARILILNIGTKKLFRESIYPCRFDLVSWLNDSSFIYTGHQQANPESKAFLLDTKLLVHHLGTDPATDQEIFSRQHNPDITIQPEDLILGELSSDRKYVLVYLGNVSLYQNVCYAALEHVLKGQSSWKHLFSPENKVVDFTFLNDSIYTVTCQDAPNSKVVALSSVNPDLKMARLLMAENQESIKSITSCKGFVFVEKTTGTRYFTLQLDLHTRQLQEIESPEKGSVEVTSFGSLSAECLYTSTSYSRPTVVYEYDPRSGKSRPSSFDRPINYPYMTNIVEKEVVVTSFDGEKIPLTLVYSKDLKLDGTAYCTLETYGAYGSSTVPSFSLRRLLLVHHQIIYAFAHVRGGGEKGDAWHKAGMKKQKPNGWKDFIACTEYLIQHNYTASSRLNIEGTSAGGIIIGRAVTERPDLFASACTLSGAVNPLLAELGVSGPANVPEFGTFNDPEECKALVEMDPVYHIKPGTRYPAILSTVGMNDPRVQPWAQAKFIGALQNATTSGKPVLLRVSYNSGHNNDDKYAYFKELADRYAYVFWTMGHPYFTYH